MKAVFLDIKTFSSSLSLAAIEEQVTTLVTHSVTLPHEVVSRCSGFDIVITNKVMLSANELEQLPQLKLICIAATGMNNVDLFAAKKLGINVKNVVGYAKQSVAQYVFSQLLHYYQSIIVHNQNTELGLWQKSDVFCVLGEPMTELAGKTIGLIGYGNLAKTVAGIARAFDMSVMIAERINCPVVRAGRESFEQVLKQSDIISLHCPQTPETENIINKETLALMKPSAVLINTARGALVNSLDLKQALLNKTIAYAILDVLEQEPPPDTHPLLNHSLNNLKITAHIAWATQESQQRLLNLIADNIRLFK